MPKKNKLKCRECDQSDKVVFAFYGPREKPVWKGYECERCWCVVRETFNAEDSHV